MRDLILILAATATNPKCKHTYGKTPYIVAHQGGSPNNRRSSISAYQNVADYDSADFLECDVTSTSDNNLLCAHSPDFHRVADPKRFKEWFWTALPQSKQNLQPIINKANDSEDPFAFSEYAVHDWFIPDYTWRLIEKLSAACPKGNPSCNGIGEERLARVDELIEIAYEKSNSSKPIGLYLEIKHQMWHMSWRSIDLIDSLIALLQKYSPDLRFPFPVYLQTFEYPDLLKLRNIIGYDTDICLVALIESTGDKPISSNQIKDDDMRESDCEHLKGLNMWNPICVSPLEAGQAQVNISCDDKHCHGLGFISSVETCVQKSILDWRKHCLLSPPPKPTLICPATTPTWLAQNQFIKQVAETMCPKLQQKLLPFWTGPQDYDARVDLTCLADIVGLDYRILTPQIEKQLKLAGIELHIWTVNDEKVVKELLSKYPSISGVITDKAQLMKSKLPFSNKPQR